MWKLGNIAETPKCAACGAATSPRWRECLACGATLDAPTGGNDPRVEATHSTREGAGEVHPAMTGAGRSLSWDPEIAALVEWFERTPPPAQPFQLSPGVFVARPAHFWEALRRDIAAGPRGARAKYGGLQQDLRRLAALVKSSESAKP